MVRVIAGLSIGLSIAPQFHGVASSTRRDGGEMFEAACKLGRLEATDRAVQVGPVLELDQGAQSKSAACMR